MKRFLSILAVCILSVFTLISCGEEEAPEGLSVVKISEEEGFKFYCPEDWMVVNSTTDAGENVYAAKVSGVNSTSITFVKADTPPVEDAKAPRAPEMEVYFENSRLEFSDTIGSALTVISPIAVSNFGNADYAFKCVYTYKYDSYDFACMQMFVFNNGEFYIFTYTSYGSVSDETSYYRRYLDDVQLAINNFMFTEKISVDKGAPEYVTDSDGYRLVSDRKLSGFDLYIPEDMEVVYSSAYVTAKITDKANISLSKATSVGISILDYLQLRREELSRIAENITDVSIGLKTEYDPESSAFDGWTLDVMPRMDTELKLGDIPDTQVVSYEYTYEYNGTKYHVYQVLGVDSGVLGSSIGASGYVFTYTATEDEYETHLDKIKTVLEKVRF